MNNETMVKNAKICYTVVNVLQKILYAAMLLFAVSLIAAVFGRTIGISPDSRVISLGNISLVLGESVTLGEMSFQTRLLVTSLAAMAIAAIYCYGLAILKNILRPMKEGRPFDLSVSNGIRRLGVVVLLGGIIHAAAECIVHFITREDYVKLMDFFQEGTIEQIRVNLNFNLAFVFAALLLFLLAHVFRYGEELQRQSDETL